LSLLTRFRPAPAPARAAGPKKAHPFLSAALTAGAALLVILVLIVPNGVARHKTGVFMPGAFLRIPLEGLLGAAILLALPTRARRIGAVLLGLALGLFAVLRIVTLGFLYVLGRSFDAVLDWPLLGDGYNALVETNGRAAAMSAVAGAILLAVVTTSLLTLAVVRLARITAAYRIPATRAVTAVLAAWVAFALVGTQLFPSAPVASDTAARFVKSTALKVPAAIRDKKAFAAEARKDAFANTPPHQFLAGLRGKDVVVGVVESYGRSALEDPKMAAVVDPVLAAGTKDLAAAGYSAKSGFLTSSTYGGGSWLAHATFQSGLWIDNEQRYRQVVSSERLTLTNAFHRGGWHTVSVEPGNTEAWPESAFYGYNEDYDSRNLGYQGPRFGWSRMPDQYTLAQFQRNVYGKPKHAPLMAEITLTSSHQPWTATPKLIDWDAVGDGSVYGPMAKTGKSKSSLWKNPEKTQNAYATSIAYSVGTLISWVEKYGDDNLVLIMFGDHQPVPVVSGPGASHDVPVTIVAHDKRVLDRIAGWGWQDGLKPNPQAPVWPMNAFRDKFLTAYMAPQEPAPGAH
jgi:hypothetical protein